MSSFDGSKNLLSTSDEMFDNVCGPCKTAGTVQEARQYCVDCPEYLCDFCANYHKRLAVTKNHNIVAVDAASGGVGRRLTIYCACNKSQQIEIYCKDHADAICIPCKGFKHHNCETLPIQQKSSGYTISELESIIKRAKLLKDEYDRLKQECSANEKKMKHSKEVCKKEIEALRKELDEYLDKLEEDILAELEHLEIKEQQRIEKQITLITTALQMLEKDRQLLNDAINDGRKETMFVANLRTSVELCGYEKRLVDLGEEMSYLTISFEKDKKLEDLKKEIKTFGSLSVYAQIAMRKEKTELLGRQLQLSRKVNIKPIDDQYAPWITVCTVMPNGSVVICDRRNNKIKLFNKSLAFSKSLTLYRPWAVSISDANNVVVTLSQQKQFRFIQVFPDMELGRIIQLDKACYGIHVAADALYVTCHEGIDAQEDGEVRVFDKQGNFIRQLEITFSWPNYITVNTAGTKVFVSDERLRTITCMTIDGIIIYQYKDQNLKRPRGIYCDDGETVLICDCDSDNVQLITADGKNGGILLSATDGLKMPNSISFRNNDDTLIVGCDRLENILLYNQAK